MVRPALDDVYDSLDLARRKLNHDLADPPVPGNKAESCRDRFGHAMVCGPISPDAIESDSVARWVALRGALAPNPANLREGACAKNQHCGGRCASST